MNKTQFEQYFKNQYPQLQSEFNEHIKTYIELIGAQPEDEIARMQNQQTADGALAAAVNIANELIEIFSNHKQYFYEDLLASWFKLRADVYIKQLNLNNDYENSLELSAEIIKDFDQAIKCYENAADYSKKTFKRKNRYVDTVVLEDFLVPRIAIMNAKLLILNNLADHHLVHKNFLQAKEILDSSSQLISLFENKYRSFKIEDLILEYIKKHDALSTEYENSSIEEFAQSAEIDDDMGENTDHEVDIDLDAPMAVNAMTDENNYVAEDGHADIAHVVNPETRLEELQELLTDGNRLASELQEDYARVTSQINQALLVDLRLAQLSRDNLQSFQNLNDKIAQMREIDAQINENHITLLGIRDQKKIIESNIQDVDNFLADANNELQNTLQSLHPSAFVRINQTTNVPTINNAPYLRYFSPVSPATATYQNQPNYQQPPSLAEFDFTTLQNGGTADYKTQAKFKNWK